MKRNESNIITRIAGCKPGRLSRRTNTRQLSICPNCNWVPDDEAARLVRENCPNVYCNYPQHKIKPYTFSEEWVDSEKDGFHEAMNLVNEVIVKSGVPVKEGKNGKVEINYDDFERAMKEKGII